jgi:signal transduction histidine kinase/CheY-like chemotaxis protein
MQQFLSNSHYKYSCDIHHIIFNDSDLLLWGEMIASSFKNIIPIDFIEIYFLENENQKLFYSSLLISDKRNNLVSKAIARNVFINKEIFHFPYYDRDKFSNIKYSDILEIGKSCLAIPIIYEESMIGVMVLGSHTPEIFRDDILPIILKQSNSIGVVYKSIFNKRLELENGLKSYSYLNHINEIIFSIDKSSNLLYYNEAFKELMNVYNTSSQISNRINLKELIGNDFQEFHHHIILAIKNGRSTFEKKYLIAGKEVWLAINMKLINAEIFCWCNRRLIQNNDDVFENEEEVKLLASLPYSIMIINEKSDIVYCNISFIKSVNYKINQLIQKSIFEFLDSKNFSAHFDFFHSSFKNLDYNKTDSLTLKLKKSDGNYISIQGLIRKIKFESKDSLVFYSSSESLDNNSLIEGLKFSKSELTDNLPIAISVTNNLLVSKYSNKELEKLSKYSTSQLEVLPLPMLLFDENQSQKIIDQINLLKHGEIFYEELLLITNEKKTINVSLTVYKLYDDENSTYIFIINNISSQINLVNELKHKANNAITTQFEEEQFLARMSHEIRTAMNGIIGLTNVMMQAGLNNEQQQFLNLIKQSTDNLLVIINDILDLSKIRSGKLEFENIPIQLNILFENIYSITLPKFANKEINYRYVYDENIPAFLEADAVRVNQILLNLISNAIKFTEKGKIEYSAQLIKIEDGYANIKISVSDTGIGIEEKNISQIFESYRQADLTTTRKYGGTGLGLPIVKQLVDLMGGKIEVKSINGKGSEFSIFLKLKISKVEKIQAEDSDGITSIQIPEGLKILVVDDNYINRLLVIHLLQSKGLEVVEAAGGYEALDILREEDIDLVLMDISMPDIDGFETTRLIRKSNEGYIKNIPIIAMTAHGFQEKIQKSKEAGMNDYIIKPFKTENLLKIILKQFDVVNDNIKDIKETKSSKVDSSLYDLAFLNEYYDNEETFINNILALYIKDTPVSIQQMEDNIKDSDVKAFKAQAHKIKTNMMMMGIKNADDFFKKSSLINPESVSTEELINLFQPFKSIVLKAVNQIKQDRNIKS